MTTFGFISIGVPEMILVLVIILIIFGPGKLPKIGRAFGETLAGFKKTANENFDEDGNKSGKKEAKNEEKE